MRRSLFGKMVLIALLGVFLASLSGAYGGKGGGPEFLPGPVPPEGMAGESLRYDIGFLWFDRLAEGRLSFNAAEGPGTFRAVLEAKTRGVAAWLTHQKMQRYVTVMETTPEGRLRPLIHETHIIKGKEGARRDHFKRYSFDYQRRRVRCQKIKDGKLCEDETFPMPSEAPVQDILTAFYNLRAGFFGPVVPGARFAIPTMRRKTVSEILVEIFLPEQRLDSEYFPPGGLLSRVTVDQEVFDTGGGSLYVWFDDQGRPAKGVVENIIGIGDVRGSLRN